mmetsp:Transcript_9881/g.25571  ORF Transcript_9881/g.25571 Transcript_9881/m.25571 type:complete len:249 (+) Transcript_9881:364-1110(+)
MPSKVRVGYGDYTRKSVLARIVTILCMITGFAFLGLELESLFSIIARRKKGSGSYIRNKRKHVVLVGGGVQQADELLLLAFLEELFRASYRAQWPDLVVMAADVQGMERIRPCRPWLAMASSVAQGDHRLADRVASEAADPLPRRVAPQHGRPQAVSMRCGDVGVRGVGHLGQEQPERRGQGELVASSELEEFVPAHAMAAHAVAAGVEGATVARPSRPCRRAASGTQRRRGGRGAKGGCGFLTPTDG